MTVETQPTPPKQGVRARERNALERISGLEQDLQQLVGGIQKVLDEFNQRLNALGELSDAVVNALGRDLVNTKLQEARDQRAQEAADAAKAALAESITKGQMKAVEIVEDDSIVSGFEVDKDGKVVVPGYVQIRYSDVLPDLQEKLKGQVVGFKLETPVGGLFEVTGIYQPVPEEEWPKPVEAPVEPVKE